jgi:serine/threonine protein kinase
MRALHSGGIIHRDLKSQNVWLSARDVAKVGDFGMSRVNSHKTMTMVGSPLWCAPEILKSENYSFGADVYSFSIIVFEALHWVEPYLNMSVMQVRARGREGGALLLLRPARRIPSHTHALSAAPHSHRTATLARPPALQIMVAVTQHHERPHLAASLPESLRLLVCDCWHPKAEMRPTFAAIVKTLQKVSRRVCQLRRVRVPTSRPALLAFLSRRRRRHCRTRPSVHLASELLG